MKRDILKSGLIVSCQARPDEPLFGSNYMAKMALAAEIGGAVAVRINTVADIVACRKAVDIPIIGLIKQEYEGYYPYITPTIKEVDLVVEAGAEIVAVDATKYDRPDGNNVVTFIKQIKKKHDVLVLADVSTVEEGIVACKAGADLIATTLSGYTPDTIDKNNKTIIELQEPDFKLIKKLDEVIDVPIVAEGRFWNGDNAVKALEYGAYAVTIGAGITRPQIITKKIADQIKDYKNRKVLL